MIGHIAEVLAAIVAAFLVGSVVGWLLHLWLDHTRLAAAQRATSDLIGRLLRLSPAPAAASLRPREPRRRRRDAAAGEPAFSGATRLKTNVQSSSRANAWSEARDDRIAREVAGPATPSEALAVAKTASAQPLPPAITVPARGVVKVTAAKIGEVWQLGEGEEKQSLPARRRPTKAGTELARTNADADDVWAVHADATWPVGSGAKLLPAPGRVAAGAKALPLRLEAPRRDSSALAILPIAKPAVDIWGDDPAPRPKPLRPAAPPLEDIVAEIEGANGASVRPSLRRPAAKVGGPRDDRPSSGVPAATGDTKFSKMLAAAADKAWAGTGGDRPTPPVASREIAQPLREPARLPAPRLQPAPATGASEPFLFQKPPARRDNLRRIRGVGHSFEHRLHDLGVYQLIQIANWSAAEQEWVNNALGSPGRVQSEEWVSQAAELLASRRSGSVAQA